MTPTGASPDEREAAVILIREWDIEIAKSGPPAGDRRHAALVEIGNAMRNRLSGLSSDRRVEDMRDAAKWFEDRPREDGSFDEIVARFADGMVHVETMDDNSVYIGFYCDDGRRHQLWIQSKKKLDYYHESADGIPPRYTASGVDTHTIRSLPAGGEGE